EPLENVAWLAARRLVESYQRSARPEWPWFESRMTYANAVLPHALFVAGRRWPTESFTAIAEASFAFLDCVTTVDEVFWPIGNNGWFSHGEEKALYDQQPVEAVTMADAALSASQSLNDRRYLETFRRARDWFHGENSLREPVGDSYSGACRDGLQPSGVNRNQGAESMLAFLGTELLDEEARQLSDENRASATGAG